MQTHDSDISSLLKLFETLRKCKNKWDCIMFEVLFIRDLEPTLNKQKDSISSKLFQNNFLFISLRFMILSFLLPY